MSFNSNNEHLKPCLLLPSMTTQKRIRFDVSVVHLFHHCLTTDPHIELPRVLRDVLQKLMTDKDIREMGQLIQASLENIKPTDFAMDPVTFPDSQTVTVPWKEGTEDLATLTEDKLWVKLGFTHGRRLPYFQLFTDPDAVVEPWSEEGQQWLSFPENPREPLHPCWHQLVGIFHMLEDAFDSEPVLLMDSIGIGKTFQVIGFVVCLSFY